MTDTPTPLRELSFGYGILQGGIENIKDTPVKFLDFCQENIENCDDLTTQDIAKRKLSFNEAEKSLIEEGLRLAKYVLSKGIIESKAPVVQWIESKGKNASATNIIIDDIPFTLKKESFELEKMTLQQLINIIADKVLYRKDLHVFEEYASEALAKWFEITRDMIIEKSKEGSFQTQDSRGRIIKLSYSESVDKLFLFFFNSDEIIEEFTSCDYKRFDTSTTSKYRENVFTVFLDKYFVKDEVFLEYKKECSIKAGENLVEFLNKKLKVNPSTKALANLFQIQKQPYYLVQTLKDVPKLYQIPSQEEFFKNIKITDVSSAVPNSYLKILTSIENIKTSEKLIIQNKIRYTQGAFNGVPESKMSIDSGSLLIAYDEI